MKKPKEYAAFISYSRKDKEVAQWLHRNIEHYAYPQKIVRLENKPPHQKFIRPVFLDLTDLEVSERSFSDDIKIALETSKFLILLCSKNSTKSEYVDKEVMYFLNVHNNDYSKIVTLFIDEVEENSIPPSILNTPIMNRHFPIFTTSLRNDSNPNLSSLYQIISYILGIDFSYIYDRYEHYAQRKKNRLYIYLGIIVALFSLVIYQMIQNIQEQKRTIEKQNELIIFEKDVYPRSIVIGYVDNFLNPVIQYLKNQNERFKIMVMMPTNIDEIKHHQDRVNDVKFKIATEIGADSLTFISLPTSMRRGSRVTTISSKIDVYKNIYLDFATTTTSFLEVARYKRQHKAYEDVGLNQIINEYAQTFICQTKEKLRNDSVFVEFYTSSQALIKHLKEREMGFDE